MASYSTTAEIEKPQTDSDSSSLNNLQLRRAKVIHNAHIGAFVGGVLTFSALVLLNDGTFPFPTDIGEYFDLFAAFGGSILSGFLFPILVTRDGYDLVWVDFVNSIRKYFGQDA
ncbi:hypothetical protein K449DRAFT_385455 [Hypoxylon sp. EC38]|nr:hypothetical protein K449DRAFT_385455 [Hypoxylon sp. EC38]